MGMRESVRMAENMGTTSPPRMAPRSMMGPCMDRVRAMRQAVGARSSMWHVGMAQHFSDALRGIGVIEGVDVA